MKELFLRDHGLEECQLTEAEMDNLGIPDYFMEGDKRTTTKDQRAEGQQRCILISGESSRSRQRLYLERRELKKSEAAAKRNTKKPKSAAAIERSKPSSSSVKRKYSQKRKGIIKVNHCHTNS
jgi:hypothetical protein